MGKRVIISPDWKLLRDHKPQEGRRCFVTDGDYVEVGIARRMVRGRVYFGQSYQLVPVWWAYCEVELPIRRGI